MIKKYIVIVGISVMFSLHAMSSQAKEFIKKLGPCFGYVECYFDPVDQRNCFKDIDACIELYKKNGINIYTPAGLDVRQQHEMICRNLEIVIQTSAISVALQQELLLYVPQLALKFLMCTKYLPKVHTIFKLYSQKEVDLIQFILRNDIDFYNHAQSPQNNFDNLMRSFLKDFGELAVYLGNATSLFPPHDERSCYKDIPSLLKTLRTFCSIDGFNSIDLCQAHSELLAIIKNQIDSRMSSLEEKTVLHAYAPQIATKQFVYNYLFSSTFGQQVIANNGGDIKQIIAMIDNQVFHNCLMEFRKEYVHV